MTQLARLEAGHAARGAMPTELPDYIVAPIAPPPKRIGPFRLTRRIGQGGMGDVWLGERDDGLFEQRVAVKLIQSHLSQAAASAFEAERRILAKLDHPDIVRLTGGGITDGGLPYLIMDYVEGIPFDEAVAALPLPQKVRLLIQAAKTVQFAHSQLIAHADLKPSNILVDTEGRVRLLDFGIAGLLGDEGETRAPTGAMTREFASPQRLAGAAPSIADDVYALGKLLGSLPCQSGRRDQFHSDTGSALHHFSFVGENGFAAVLLWHGIFGCRNSSDQSVRLLQWCHFGQLILDDQLNFKCVGKLCGSLPGEQWRIYL